LIRHENGKSFIFLIFSSSPEADFRNSDKHFSPGFCPMFGRLPDGFSAKFRQISGRPPADIGRYPAEFRQFPADFRPAAAVAVRGKKWASPAKPRHIHGSEQADDRTGIRRVRERDADKQPTGKTARMAEGKTGMPNARCGLGSAG